MPKCKNDPTKSYKGNEPSPKGLGLCAHAEKEGVIKKGKDKNNWIVKKTSNGSKRWIKCNESLTKLNIHIGYKKYFTHNFDERPFLVYVGDNDLYIYLCEYENNIRKYDKLLKYYKFKNIFIGNLSSKYKNYYNGCCILLDIGNNKYIYIEKNLYTFKSLSKITNLQIILDKDQNNSSNYSSKKYSKDINNNYYLYDNNIIVKNINDKILKYFNNNPYFYYYDLDYFKRYVTGFYVYESKHSDSHFYYTYKNYFKSSYYKNLYEKFNKVKYHSNRIKLFNKIIKDTDKVFYIKNNNQKTILDSHIFICLLESKTYSVKNLNLKTIISNKLLYDLTYRINKKFLNSTNFYKIK